MYAKLESYVVQGAQAVPVTVEVHASRGVVGITIVGLAERAVRESRERLRSALTTTGVDLPPLRITINLAPPIWLKREASSTCPLRWDSSPPFATYPPRDCRGRSSRANWPWTVRCGGCRAFYPPL